MSLEPVLLKEYRKDKPQQKWVVYYESETGDVITVGNKIQEGQKNPHLLTESDDARKILMGTIDPKKFAVVDINQELRLVEKSAVIRIKEAENKLSAIPVNNKESADINIILYVQSWKMEVNFNQDTLYRMTGKRFFRNVSVNPEEDGDYDMISLYMIKKNDPNFLLMQLDIDPGELIEEGYMMFDMTPLRRLVSLNDISIMTRKIFKSYRIKKQALFTGADYASKYTKRRTFLLPSVEDSEINTSFTLFKRGEQFYLKSNFGDPQESKIYTDIGIYVTAPKNPNQLLGYLTLPLADIGWESTIELDTDLQLDNCGFLCRESSRNLTFSYKGETINV